MKRFLLRRRTVVALVVGGATLAMLAGPANAASPHSSFMSKRAHCMATTDGPRSWICRFRTPITIPHDPASPTTVPVPKDPANPTTTVVIPKDPANPTTTIYCPPMPQDGRYHVQMCPLKGTSTPNTVKPADTKPASTTGASTPKAGIAVGEPDPSGKVSVTSDLSSKVTGSDGAEIGTACVIVRGGTTTGCD